MSASNYLELELMDHITNVGAFAYPTHAVALCTGDPGEAATGASMSEHPNSGAYARLAAPAFDAGASRVSANTSDMEFAVPSGAWTDITHWAIVDSTTHGAGNVLFYGAFDATYSPVANKRLVVAAGALIVTVDAGGYHDYMANQLLDHCLGNGDMGAITNRWIAWCTAVVADSETGATITEVANTNGYARTAADGVWATAAAGATSNNASITSAAATGSWSTISDYAIVDSATHGAGNAIWHDTLDASFAIGNTDKIQFASGALDITQD